jgi:hypothetical protein
MDIQRARFAIAMPGVTDDDDNFGETACMAK